MAPHAKPEACVGCPLYEAEGPVWGEGPQNAEMFILGEAPGEQEARFLRPFIGGSGRVLDALLRSSGINRGSAFVSNTVKCRPTYKRNGKLENRQPTEEEIRFCAQHLVRELQHVKPNLVVCVGATPLYVIKGTTAIGKLRGVPFEAAGQKCLATFHPAFVMRQQDYFPVAVWDLRRAAAEAKSPTLRRVEVSYQLSADPGTTDVLDRARRTGFAVFDLETTGLDGRTDTIICLGLGTRPYQAEVFRWSAAAHHLWQAIAADPAIEKVGQNSESFDIPFTEEKGVAYRGPTADTMLMFHLVNSSLPKDLGFISSFYTDQEYWKDDAKKDLFLYNAQDVDNTTRAYLALREELRSLDMLDLYYSSVAPLQPVLRKMSRHGIRKDGLKALAWSRAILAKAAEREKVLHAAIGPVNIHSPKQLMHLLYEQMGLPVQYTKDKARGMRPTANMEALDTLSKLTENPIFRQIYEIRQARHQVATYLEVEADDNNFVHPSFGSAKAATGRINSWNPNAQNIPAPLREIYLPDTDDHVFLEADWSQIEWRLQVVLSADPVGLALLASGRDNHTSVASEILGKPYEAVTEQERYRAKFVVHGLGYGRGAASIAKQYNLPVSVVEQFIARFAARFSVFWTWRSRLPQFVEQHAYLRNPFGRRRWWYTRQVTEVYNFLAQSTGADMMYKALIAFDKELPRHSRLALTVHDSVLLSVPKESVREVRDCANDIMRQKWPQITAASRDPGLVEQYFPGGFTCPSDIALGHTWAECKNKKAQAALRQRYGVD